MKAGNERRERPTRGIAWLVAMACALAGCDAEDGPRPAVPRPSATPPRAERQEFVGALKDSQARLADAIQQRELAEAKGAALLRVTEDDARRIERLRRLLGERAPSDLSSKPAPSSGRTPAPSAADKPAVAEATPPKSEATAKEKAPKPSDWGIRELHEELQLLVAKRETIDPRGDTGWHRHAAEAADRWERLKEATLKLDLPRDFLPEDDLALLDRPKLEELRNTWTRSLEQIRKEAAQDPSGTGSRRIREAETRLQRIGRALDGPPVNLADRFAKLPNPPKITPEFLAWMNGDSTEALNARIELREQQLLKKTLAIDETDLGAMRRLADLQHDGAAVLRERLVQSRSRLAVDRFEGFSPDGPARSSLVKELIANRFKVPARAVRAEALLTLHWGQLKMIDDLNIRKTLLPDGHGRSVIRWMVSQMTNADLAEAKVLAEQARDYMRKLESLALSDPEKRSGSYDLKVVSEEIAAIDEEYRYREANGGRRSAPAVDSAALDGRTLELLTNQAAAKVEDLEETIEGKQMLAAAEDRYIWRTDQPLPEIVASRNRHHFDGIEHEVTELARDAERYRKLRDTYSRSGFSGTLDEAKKLDESFVKAKAELEFRANRIREAIRETGSIEVAKSEDLWRRVDRAMADTRGPPEKFHPGGKLAANHVIIVDIKYGPGHDGWPKPPDGTPPTDPTSPSGSDGPGPKNPGPGRPGGGGTDPEGPTPGRPGGNGPDGRPSPGGTDGPLAGGDGQGRPSPRPPGAPNGDGTGPEVSRMSSFGDILIAQSKGRGNAELDRLSGQLQETTAPTASSSEPSAYVPDGKPYVIVESVDPSAIVQATKGQRPELKGWIRSGREDIRFEDIDGLKSMKVIPGGVALGRVAEVEGKWSDATLVYDRSEGRLMLVKPSGERLKFPPVAPEVLKTCFLYARSKDPVAISIGYTGERSPLERDAASQVLIHPELRDTQVGLDIINADRLPWTLDEETLPNGRPNPVRGVMKDLVRRAGDPNAGIPTKALLERLGKIVDLEQKTPVAGRSESYRETIIKVLDGDSPLDFLLKAIAITSGSPEDRFATYTRLEDEALTKLYRAKILADAKKEIPDAEWPEVERKVNNTDLDGLIKPEGLKKLRDDQLKAKPFFTGLPADRDDALRNALILVMADEDREIGWRYAMAATLAVAGSRSTADLAMRDIATQVLQLMKHAHLSLITDGPIRVKQVGAEMAFEGGLVIRYVHGKIDASDTGLTRRDEPEPTPEAGDQATRLIPELDEAYPPLKATRDYARYIALLRWALKEGNVAWLDVADLGPVAYRTKPTPDYIVRGSGSQVKAAMREFGLDERSK